MRIGCIRISMRVLLYNYPFLLHELYLQGTLKALRKANVPENNFAQIILPNCNIFECQLFHRRHLFFLLTLYSWTGMVADKLTTSHFHKKGPL